jgi:predicted dehydrogenase
MTRCGILGAGEIARVFANGLRFSKSGTLVAVASMTDKRREALASDFAVPRRYSRYEDLLNDPEVDAIYISLIHPLHAQWARTAAQAGKHILVEKPMAMNAREAAEMVEAARKYDVFLMEAFMYRCHPQMAKLAEIVRQGMIGEVLSMRLALSFAAPFDANSRLFNTALGGGAILDVGCYPTSLSRFVAGAAIGKLFAEPSQLKAVGTIGHSKVETFAAAVLEFPSGIIAEIACGISSEMPTNAEVFGTRGSVLLPNPWLPSSPARTALKPLPMDTLWPTENIFVRTSKQGSPTEIAVAADRDLYSYEADMVDRHLAERQAPAMRWDDSIGNMRLLDRWREEVGRQ